MLESFIASTLALQWNSVSVLIAASGSVLALLLTVRNARTLSRQNKTQQSLNRQLQEDNRALAKSAVGMGQKVLDTERKLSDVLKKQISLLNSQPEHPSYDQASKLIAMGATENDLVNSCGFSHAEAELLLSLKGQGQSLLGQVH